MRSALLEQSAAATCLAIVCAADGVRFLAAAPSRELLLSQLVAYVSEQAPQKLWPDDAELIAALLSHGAFEPAIDCYFASVGDRWDREWLHTENINIEGKE